MEWPQVRDCIEAGEGRSVEFKRGPGDLRDIGKAICAFANTDGGLIIVGIDDGGTIVGVKEHPETMQERLTSFLQTACSTPVSARCGRQETRDGWVHWIEVLRQRGFEPLRYRQRVWIRRERSSVQPSPSELQDLFNAFGFVMTEEQVIPAAGADDIDPEVVHAFLRAQGLDMEQWPQPDFTDDLRNLDVLDEVDGALHATLFGLMAFGKEPQAYPQTRSFFVECTAYSGADRGSQVLLVGEGKGRLDEQVRRTMGWTRSLGRREVYGDVVRQDVPLLPTRALREAIVNAVIHRDYTITGSKVMVDVFCDRIEVTSPGALPNRMTIDKVRRGGRPRSRNESMAHYAVVAGMMEQRGRGWLVMRHAMQEFNETEPEIEHDADSRWVCVTLRLNPDAARDEPSS